MIIEKHENINVLRDDLLPGGTKSVFLGKILDLTKDCFVYASPVYGAMQIALSHYCSSIGKQAVIFCAKRKVPHNNSLKAKEAGGIVYQVPYGYLNNCQSKALQYAKDNNGQCLKFGGNYEISTSAIADRMKQVSSKLGFEPDIIYCAVGSGTLLKGIIAGTSNARIFGVMVGTDFKQPVPDRVTLIRYEKGFEFESKISSPFPSCKNYDLKAWEYCRKGKHEGNVFFWNVF